VNQSGALGELHIVFSHGYYTSEQKSDISVRLSIHFCGQKKKKISCTFDTVPFQNVAINLKFVLVAVLNKTFINMNDFFQLLT